MFQGCFSQHGLGSIILLKDSVTGQTYAKVINKYVIPTLNKYFSQDNRIFQKDNALSHHSKVAVAACKNAEIVKMDWPVQSSNLNLIENLQIKMKVMVYHYILSPSNIQEFEKYIKNAQKDILLEYYKNLIKSMPQRIDMIIATNENNISY